jgi:hypothetical protein
MFSSANKEKFLTEWLYFSVFSLTGCSIQVLVTFPDDTLKGKKNKLKEDEE